MKRMEIDSGIQWTAGSSNVNLGPPEANAAPRE
jgi:hypothetical protein